MPDLRKQRAAKGLCPECGKMAAPYYLCGDCHFLGQLRKVLRRGQEHNAFGCEVDPADKRKKRWFLTRPKDGIDFPYAGADPCVRGKPRLRGRPVDIDEELIRIVEASGMRGITEEEIIAAWLKLRPRPNRGSVAANMAKIIAAKDKRMRKQAMHAGRDGTPDCGP